MAARVHELLSQLEQIDYRHSPTSSPVGNQRSQVNIRERNSMKRSLTHLLASPVLQDSNLRTELDDLKVQQKVLNLQKKKESQNFLKQCEKIDTQVKAHKNELITLEKQLNLLEVKAENVEKSIKEKQDEKLEAFKYALKPLEDTANTINDEKYLLEQRQGKLAKRMEELDSIRSVKTEELKNVLAQRNEYAKNREKLQKLLNDIKENDNCNYKEYVHEIETKEILNAIKNRKSKQTTSLKELEKKLAEIEVEIENCSKRHQDNKGMQVMIPITIEKEILDMENYLNILCKDLGVLSLMDFISQFMKKRAVSGQDLIIREQISLIEDKELHIEEKWTRQKEMMESKIIEMRKVTEEQEVELYALISNSAPDAHLESALQDMQNTLEMMRKEAEKAHRVHKVKMETLQKWKDDNRKRLLMIENNKFIEDGEVIKGFKRELQKNIPKLDQWKTIESVINKYVEKLNERNDNFQEILRKETERLEFESKQESEMKELVASKNALLTDRDSLHREFLKIITLEKAAIKKFENFKIEIEIERKKLIEKITETNMNKNKSSLLQIQKKRGDKAVGQIREKEVQTVKETQEKQREGVKKKLEGLSSDISHWENLIQKMDSSINDLLKPEIASIDQDTVKTKQELSLVTDQLRILNDAEDDVSAKLDYLMESKKRDINRSLHRALEIHGSDVDLKKIYRLSTIRDKKIAAVKQLLEEKEKIRKEHENRIKTNEAESSKVKTKTSQLEESIQNQIKSKKQFEIFSKQMTTIEHDVPEDDIPDIELAQDSKDSQDSKDLKDSKDEDSLPEDQPEGQSSVGEIEIEEIKEDKVSDDPHNSTTLTLKGEIEINIDIDDASQLEKDFFNSIIPLLTGVHIYKKLSQRNSLALSEFDPLELDPPESFGYALRVMRLNKSLSQIEFTHPQKKTKEGAFAVNTIISTVIPKHTSEMIKAQKKNWLNEGKEQGVTTSLNKKYRDMKKAGLINYSDPSFKAKSKEANYYPFFITLEKGGRIELIASGYSAFKHWVDGVNLLVRTGKQLQRLSSRIS